MIFHLTTALLNDQDSCPNGGHVEDYLCWNWPLSFVTKTKQSSNILNDVVEQQKASSVVYISHLHNYYISQLFMSALHEYVISLT